MSNDQLTAAGEVLLARIEKTKKEYEGRPEAIAALEEVAATAKWLKEHGDNGHRLYRLSDGEWVIPCPVPRGR